MSPNSSTSSSDRTGAGAGGYRRFLAAFSLAAVLLLVPAALTSLYLGPVGGDVARVGLLSSRDFAPRRVQAPLVAMPSGYRLQDPEILVLGDSFANTNAWQTEVYRRTGMRTLTWHFERVPCIDDWLEKAVSGALRASAKVVIVETIERSFLYRFRDPVACTRDHYPPQEIAGGPVNVPRSPWAIFPMDIRFIVRSAGVYSRAHEATGRFKSKRTIMVDLQRADLFSHALSHRLAYYGDDEWKLGEWSEPAARAALDRFAALRERAAARGVTLVLMVVPDKSSVYLPFVQPGQRIDYADRGERLFPLIAERLGPEYDLLVPLRRHAATTVDLYRPDDTHVGNDGYRLLGEIVAGWVQPTL